MPDANQEKPPRLGPAERNPEEWVTYLQQMLNWFYQMQVVSQDGDYGQQTRNAVEHLRGQLGLPAEPVVDDAVWKALGVDDASVEEVDLTVELIQGNEDTSWAAAIAMVLTAKGDPKTLDEVLSKADPQRRSATEARQLAADEFHLAAQSCQATDAASWTGVLKSHGALWVAAPTDEQRVFVVAGIKPEGDKVKIHVVDPRTGNTDWLDFEQFRQDYGIGDQGEIEVMAAG